MRTYLRKVFINGTFDIIHRGHIELIQFARKCGESILVAIDSDRRVKELKGTTRPFNTQDDRRYVLENIQGINAVTIFDTDEELCNIITSYKPDIMVKGSDYKNTTIVGEQFVPEIIFYDKTRHTSTQAIECLTDRG